MINITRGKAPSVKFKDIPPGTFFEGEVAGRRGFFLMTDSWWLIYDAKERRVFKPKSEEVDDYRRLYAEVKVTLTPGDLKPFHTLRLGDTFLIGTDVYFRDDFITAMNIRSGESRKIMRDIYDTEVAVMPVEVEVTVV